MSPAPGALESGWPSWVALPCTALAQVKLVVSRRPVYEVLHLRYLRLSSTESLWLEGIKELSGNNIKPVAESILQES